VLKISKKLVVALWLCQQIVGTCSETAKMSMFPLPPVEENCIPLWLDEPLVDVVELAAFNQPGTVLPSEVDRSQNEARFLTRVFDSAPETRLQNNFVSIPEFDSGLVLYGRDVAIKIGGYVKADLIKDFDAIDSTDSFDTTSIPVDAPDRENSRFHARQSRLSFDTRWRIEDEVVRAFVEGDFFGGESNGSEEFRLRHAYGTIGRFTAGQTWTTFTDPGAVPQTIDFEGAVSNVNRRQGLVRWDHPIVDEFLSWAIAVEDPNIIIESSSEVVGSGRTQSPDFITRLRVTPDWGEFQGAFVLRELGFQPAGQPVITENAWGFNFAGSLFLLDRTKGYSQVTFGEGIGSYRGSPDVVATGPNSGAILPMFGWMVGLHHEWNSNWTSNFTYSELILEDIPGQSPDNLRSTTYLAVNLIANPFERVFCGIEYLYGVRENVSGDSGSANRIQIACGFFLP